MNLSVDLNTILSGVIIILTGYGVKGLMALKEQVSQQNGRLGKMETWMTGHEKIDDERHKRTQEGIANLWGKLDGE